MSVIGETIQRHWAKLEPLLTIRTERDYQAAVGQLQDLLDEVGTNLRHPLYGFLDTLGTLIEAYEERHHRLPDASGGEVLRGLMEEHGLTQSDLPEIGSQGVVSEIAQRFRVSPAAFLRQ